MEKRVCRGVVQGRVEIRDAEEVGDENNKAESAVDHIAPDYRARHIESCVFDFFG